MAILTHDPLKAGDQLACSLDHVLWSLVTVEKITATGRIDLGGGIVLNPDLTQRGRRYSRYSYYRITPEIIEKLEHQETMRSLRETCRDIMNTCFMLLNSISKDQLRILADGLVALKEKVEK